MSYTDILDDIKDLFNTYNIGDIIGTPVSVSGGLMHKMYKVTTCTHTYAIKCLNTSIMQRSNVLDNMINSERIAKVFSNHFPVVAALNFEGRNVLSSNGKYYMVFDWLEGSSIYPPAISEENCYSIGSVLGQIHHLNITLPGIIQEEVDSITYDWKRYSELAKEQDVSWRDIYRNVAEKLILWTSRVNDASIYLSHNRVISHRDLDPKNVLWNNRIPYLIDWEAAGYVNPYQELLEVLIYWSNNGQGELDKNKFTVLLNAYKNYMSTETANWGIILDSGYTGMLGWLEYSLKRALGIESMDEDERKLGAEQVVGTMKELERYDRLMKTINEWLSE